MRDRRLEQLAYSSLTEAECPSSEELAMYVLQQIDEADQLRLAAHVRSCPLCQELAALCAPPDPDPTTSSLVRIIGQLLPPQLVPGRRSDVGRDHVRQYIAADLVIELTIPPPAGEAWELVGQVLRGGVGLAGCQVNLRSGKRRPIMRESDTDGFFAFSGLVAGLYQLVVAYEQLRVEINELNLRTDA